MLWNHSSLASFLSLTVKAHVHSVTHGQLRKPQHTYVKRAVRKAHFSLNRACTQVHFRSSLLVQAEILNGMWSKCAIDADDTSETYEDMATGKRRIRRFQRPTQVWRRPGKRCLRISTNNSFCLKLESLTYILPLIVLLLSHATIFKSWTLWI